ncbi:hypothetical protein Bca52824_022825 [Brassica carinata]|uniref:Uncharacterized protein n=1 Tax=Brassica carinata TaxID=52824 RepID=A0A8X7VGP3_BRACI|nr:hypothetical protein Bca52824_022825 [Brassica carinata]
MPSREDFLRYLQQNPVGDGTPSFVDTFQGFETYFSQPTANTNIETFHQLRLLLRQRHPSMTVDDLLAPGRESLTVLDPWLEGLLGKENFKAILKMMKSDLPGAYPTYKHLPVMQNKMVQSIYQQFTWEPSITETVKIAYEKKAQKSFSSNLCEWKTKWKLNKDPPEWVSSDNWEPRLDPDMLAFLEDAHRRIVETVKEKINDQLTQGGSTETNNLTQADINHLALREIPVIKGHRFGFGTLPDPGQVPPASFMSNLDQEERLRIANEKIAMATEKIVTLENDKAEKDKVIQDLQDLAHKVVDKFPDLLHEDEDATQE